MEQLTQSDPVGGHVVMGRSPNTTSQAGPVNQPRGTRRLIYTSDPSNLAFYQSGRHLSQTPDAKQARTDPARPQDLMSWVGELASNGIDAYAQVVFSQGWAVLFRSESLEYDARPQNISVSSL